MGHPTADPLPPVADTRCAHCRAAVRPGAAWCSLCHADLRPPPAPVVQAPVVPAAVVPGPAVPAPVLQAPPPAPAAAQAGAPQPAVPQPVWTCTTCDAPNAMSASACTTCGTGFLAGLRASEPLLELPVVGDVTRLSRLQRLGLAFGTMFAFLGLLLVLGLLLS